MQNVGALVLGIEPEAQFVLLQGKALDEFPAPSARMDLFVAVFRFFYHDFLEVVHSNSIGSVLRNIER